MDPALQELLAEGEPEDEVALILRLRDPTRVPAGVRVVSRFGTILTVRALRGGVPTVWADATVQSVKAPQRLAPDVEPGSDVDGDETEALPATPEDRHVLDDIPETGRGVVLGCVDWGMDWRHHDFVEPAPDGGAGPGQSAGRGESAGRNERTRLLGMWDQRPVAGASTTSSASNEPYGYGRVFTPGDINRALAAADPYATLGYHPADFDAGLGAHGTHTLSIAAGNGRGGGPRGVAPEASLAFVSLDRQSGPVTTPLTRSHQLLEALDFIFRLAADRPCVVNCSLGRHAGEHTGRSLVEMAIDELVSAAPNRAVILSGGNYWERRAHASFTVRPGEVRTFSLEIDPADRTTNELDIWYPGRDRLTIELATRDGRARRVVPLGQKAAITVGGAELARIRHRQSDPQNGDHQCTIFLEPNPAVRDWEVTLRADDVVDGRVHAWIERDSGCRACQSRFPEDIADPRVTIGSLASGYRSIVVGAYGHHWPDRRLGRFSSSGTTRDGRQKPDLVAPGVMVLGARSASYAGDGPRYVRQSGSSMAAPAVAGTVALMMSASSRPLPIEETRRALLSSCDPPPPGSDLMRHGNGFLNIARAVAAVRPPPVAVDQPAEVRAVETAADEGEASAELDQTDDVEAEPGEAIEADIVEAIEADIVDFGTADETASDAASDAADGEVIEAEPLDASSEDCGCGGDASEDLVAAAVSAPRLTAAQTREEVAMSTMSPWIPASGEGDPVEATSPSMLAFASSTAEALGPCPDEDVPHPRLLVRSAVSPAVREAQRKLNLFHAQRLAAGLTGIRDAPLVEDCIFGEHTFNAVLSFQQIVLPGQPAEHDGKIGPNTWAQLDRVSPTGPGTAQIVVEHLSFGPDARTRLPWDQVIGLHVPEITVSIVASGLPLASMPSSISVQLTSRPPNRVGGRATIATTVTWSVPRVGADPLDADRTRYQVTRPIADAGPFLDLDPQSKEVATIVRPGGSSDRLFRNEFRAIGRGAGVLPRTDPAASTGDDAVATERPDARMLFHAGGAEVLEATVALQANVRAAAGVSARSLIRSPGRIVYYSGHGFSWNGQLGIDAGPDGVHCPARDPIYLDWIGPSELVPVWGRHLAVDVLILAGCSVLDLGTAASPDFGVDWAELLFARRGPLMAILGYAGTAPCDTPSGDLIARRIGARLADGRTDYARAWLEANSFTAGGGFPGRNAVALDGDGFWSLSCSGTTCQIRGPQPIPTRTAPTEAAVETIPDVFSDALPLADALPVALADALARDPLVIDVAVAGESAADAVTEATAELTDGEAIDIGELEADEFVWHADAESVLSGEVDGGETATDGESFLTEQVRLVGLIAGGQRDENRLTNEVFFARHPELGGRPLTAADRELAAEWRTIRDSLVRPLLRGGPLATAGPAAAAPATSGSALASGRHTPMSESALRRAWEAYRCAESRMTEVRILGWTTPVNPLTIDAWRALAAALEGAGYRAERAWVYNCRSIANKPTWSLHAYGLAIDIDAKCNPNNRTRDGRPVRFSPGASQADRCADVRRGTADTSFTPAQIAAVETIRTVDGLRVFSWGGRWTSTKDSMHFQIAVTPAELQRGLAPAAVATAAS